MMMMNCHHCVDHLNVDQNKKLNYFRPWDESYLFLKRERGGGGHSYHCLPIPGVHEDEVRGDHQREVTKSSTPYVGDWLSIITLCSSLFSHLKNSTLIAWKSINYTEWKKEFNQCKCAAVEFNAEFLWDHYSDKWLLLLITEAHTA